MQEYIIIKEEKDYPKSNKDRFFQVLKRSVKLELFGGLKIVFKIFIEALFKGKMHTLKYPMEKFQLSTRYRAVHKLQNLLESGNTSCIGCGLCEKICVANCIKIETKENKKRKEVVDYSINLGRCIYCGYCADVCPELAIVHGGDYENASEQRAHFVIKEDLEVDPTKHYFDGYGSLSKDADENIKKTPTVY
jgi:NADH-quinone oxidoreductase subunit I